MTSPSGLLRGGAMARMGEAGREAGYDVTRKVYDGLRVPETSHDSASDRADSERDKILFAGNTSTRSHPSASATSHTPPTGA